MRGIVLIGERRNGQPWKPALKEHELNPRFLLKMSAFRLGAGRAFLSKKLGLRWDAAMNLLMPAWNGTEAWNHERAQQVAEACRTYLEAEFTTIILLGRHVSRAFGVSLDFLQADGKYAVLPHPSGVNHYWNDPAHVTAAQAFCKMLTERSYPCPTTMA